MSVSLRPILGLAVALGGLSAALALTGARADEPKYPHVNMARTWVVDPKWPGKPADFVWGHVPGIAVDAKDNVYVFTRSEPPVQVYDAKGKLLRTWGQKHFKTAHHIKVDHEGHIWTTDVGEHVVEKWTPDGKLLLALGTRGKAGRDQRHLNMPTDIAVLRDGTIYVSDGYGNARVVYFTPEGKYLGEWGELGSAPGQFSIPHAIAADSKGRIYVADRNNVRVQVFDRKGKLLDSWRDLIVPWGFAVTKNDEIWVCGSSPMQWRKSDAALGCPPKDQIFMRFTGQGRLLQLLTLPKGIDGLEHPGEVNWVHAIAVDSRGNLYLGDIIGRRAQKFVLREP
ncbi:MAG TPA: peptidyl-alpha-hydroxyglycine alpha-amidating lyase family protein [Gemmataceae bacterium]|nr:peptidyl-alpha-hydroxyglycine alpha-amidating lyase family protein [Gemmataceae bacterium]